MACKIGMIAAGGKNEDQLVDKGGEGVDGGERKACAAGGCPRSAKPLRQADSRDEVQRLAAGRWVRTAKTSPLSSLVLGARMPGCKDCGEDSSTVHMYVGGNM